MWENEVKHTCIESTKPEAKRFFLIIRTNEFIWPKKINYALAHVPFVHMMMGAVVLLVPPFVDHGSVRSFEYCCIVSDMLCLFNIHFSFDILLNGIYLSYNYKGETVFFIPWRDNTYIYENTSIYRFSNDWWLAGVQCWNKILFLSGNNISHLSEQGND